MDFIKLLFPGFREISALEKKLDSSKKEDENKAAVGCYKADINCENCHELLEFELPKGQTVVNYCEKLICSNCGCPVFEYCTDEED